MEYKQKRIISTRTLTLLMILLLFFQTPSFSASVNRLFLIPLLSVYGLYFLSLLYDRKKLYLPKKAFPELLAGGSLLLMEVVYRALRVTTVAAPTFTLVRFFMLYLALIPVYHILTLRQKRMLLTASITSMLLIMAYVTYSSVRYGGFRVDPLGLQVTQFCTAVLMLTGASFSCWCLSRRKKQRRIYAALTVICLMFSLLVGQKGIVMVLLAVMIYLLMLFNGKRTMKHLMFSSFLLLALLIFAFSYEAILDFIIHNIWSTRLSVRLQRILTLLKEGSLEAAGGSLEGRVDLIMLSLNTFFKNLSNFLLGVGDHNGYEFIGHHSELADMLACYGCLGGAVMFAILRSMFGRMKREAGGYHRPEIRTHLRIIMLVFILRGMMGTLLHSAIGVQMLCTIPLMYKMIDEEESL